MTLVLMSLTLFTYALITVVFLKCLYDFSLLLHYTVIINSMSFHCYNLFGALYEYRIVFCTYFALQANFLHLYGFCFFNIGPCHFTLAI